MDELVYRIDTEGRLSSVNEEWHAFALANGAPELAGEGVIGTRLFDFIRGGEARHLTELLLRRARETASAVTVPFGCHSSQQRRLMEMTVTPLPDGFEFRTRLRSVVPWGKPAAGLLPDPADLLLLCSWCNRVKSGDEWVEIEEAAEALQFLDREHLPAVTHGICEACVRLVMSGWHPSDPRVRT